MPSQPVPPHFGSQSMLSPTLKDHSILGVLYRQTNRLHKNFYRLRRSFVTCRKIRRYKKPPNFSYGLHEAQRQPRKRLSRGFRPGDQQTHLPGLDAWKEETLVLAVGATGM